MYIFNKCDSLNNTNGQIKINIEIVFVKPFI